VDRANDPDATTTVLDALAAEVTAAQVMGMARLNGTSDATTLRDLIREAWRSTRRGRTRPPRCAVASFRPECRKACRVGPSWDRSKAATCSSRGPRIGPVGGQIVAEVLVGLIDGDGQSYRA
jgi:hypothetical protein